MHRWLRRGRAAPGQRCARVVNRSTAGLLARLLLAGAVLVGGPTAFAQAGGTPAAPPATVAAGGVTATVLATRVLDEAPADRRWVVRRGHPLNEDAHAHSGGFIYAARGGTYLIVDDAQGTLMPAGTAAWAPDGIGHLHATAARASSEGAADAGDFAIWTILLEREHDARRPGAVATSAPLIGLLPGPYQARLLLLTVEPGAATPLRTVSGPEFAYTLDGTWELLYDGVHLPLAGAHGYLADPGVPHRLRNSGAEPGRLLAAQLVPAGRPADEPVAEAP